MVLKAKATELPGKDVQDRLSCQVVFSGPLCRLDGAEQCLTMDWIGVEVCVAGCPCVW